MRITSSRQAYNEMRPVMSLEVEEFWALALGPSKKLIEKKCLFRGTVDACPFHPRDVFRFACLANASSLLMVHNHPSKDPRPSKSDQIITRQVLAASQLMEIPLIDHIIITETEYFSFADAGYL